MWFIAAGRKAAKYDVFKKRNFVAIGWNLGDLSNSNKDEIEEKYLDVYGNTKSKGNEISQINKFVNEIEKGDYIITSRKSTRSYLIGICISDYFCSNELDDNNEVDGYYYNCRYVDWFGEIGWEDLHTEAKDFINQFSVRQVKGSIKEEFLTYIPSFNKEKRNKIYFGAPGTGKSYKLNRDKDKLLGEVKDNFERVTFHPDYTYANFVGTYKPISIKNENKEDSISYEYVPGPFMRTLIKALKNPYEPFVLIIEEINRANVSAVFGDVFQLIDRNKFNNSEYSVNASKDINDYFNEELLISEIPEDKQGIVNKYWKFLLGEEFEKINIPHNMFIWSTMNSADQGVFPMDTAFKRRWDFEYLGIDEGAHIINSIVIDVPSSWNIKGDKLSWNDLRVELNKELLRNNIDEDKLMGPFFAFKEYINLKLESKEFISIFENKVIMYLFEDAARPFRKKFFTKDNKESYITYSNLCKRFEEDGILIFSERIQEKFIKTTGE